MLRTRRKPSPRWHDETESHKQAVINRDEQLGVHRIGARKAGATHIIFIEDHGQIIGLRHAYKGAPSAECPTALREKATAEAEFPRAHVWLEVL